MAHDNRSATEGEGETGFIGGGNDSVKGAANRILSRHTTQSRKQSQLEGPLSPPSIPYQPYQPYQTYPHSTRLPERF